MGDRSASRSSTSSHRVAFVKRGDTLVKLARRCQVTVGWTGLWSLNKRAARNPHWIYIGQILKLN